MSIPMAQITSTEIIFQDITRTEPIDVSQWTRPYSLTDELQKQVRDIQRNHRRQKTMRNREGILVNAYYTGELLDSLNHEEFRRIRTTITPYYQSIAKKTYLLFNAIGFEQLLRTQLITAKMIERLRPTEIPTLISRAKSFLTTTIETEVGGELSPGNFVIDQNSIDWDDIINNL